MPFRKRFGKSVEDICYRFYIHTAVAHRVFEICTINSFSLSIEGKGKFLVILGKCENG